MCWTVLSLFVGLYNGLCVHSYDVLNAFTRMPVAFARVPVAFSRIRSQSGAFGRFLFVVAGSRLFAVRRTGIERQSTRGEQCELQCEVLVLFAA